MEMVWDWKSIGSLLATLLFLQTAMRDFLPAELRRFLRSVAARLLAAFRPTNTIIIDEHDAAGSNELFEAAQSYLSNHCLDSAPILRLSKPHHARALTSALPDSHSATDSFDGVPLHWQFHCIERQSATSSPFGHRSSMSSSTQQRHFELSFHRRHRAVVHGAYIPYIMEVAERLRFKSRERRLYTNRSISSFATDEYRLWSSVPFQHPSTFETLAIDPALRDDIRSDLLRFSARRDYYARAGRAWKRGYLLHGPPGTGKTSLIAAIANFVEFDVYDLELTAVTSNAHLRKLLVSTTSRSVIVIEDVDCSLDLSDRNNKNTWASLSPDDTESPPPPPPAAGPGGSKVSLSGVLNFVDGLWSSCVGERLMVFTTNHPERLDPALLRPGRMDRKIHLSYCEPAAFRTLARNYLEGEVGGKLMREAEALLGEVRMTPAEIAEVLMGCDGGDADEGMMRVLDDMRRRKAADPRPPPAEGDGDELVD